MAGTAGPATIRPISLQHASRAIRELATTQCYLTYVQSGRGDIPAVTPTK